MGARKLSKAADEQLVDKVLESKLAELIGTTAKALEHRRLSGAIPPGVWMKIGGRVMYSLERYNAWAENQWAYLLESIRAETACESASRGTESGAASGLPIRRPRRGSQRPEIFVLV